MVREILALTFIIGSVATHKTIKEILHTPTLYSPFVSEVEEKSIKQTSLTTPIPEVLSATITISPTPSSTPSFAPSIKPIPTQSPKSKISIEILPSPSNTPAPTNSATPTSSPTIKPTITTTPSPSNTPTPTILKTKVTQTELELYFSKYSDQYKVDKELLKRIAKCESGFNPNAKNLSYVGLYQFSENTWKSQRRRMGLNSDITLRSDAEESIKTAAYMISNGGQGAWPNCK